MINRCALPSHPSLRDRVRGSDPDWFPNKKSENVISGHPLRFKDN